MLAAQKTQLNVCSTGQRAMVSAPQNPVVAKRGNLQVRVRAKCVAYVPAWLASSLDWAGGAGP